MSIGVFAADYSFLSSIPSGWSASPNPSSYETTNNGTNTFARGATWGSNFTLTFSNAQNVTSVVITYSTNNNQTGFSIAIGGNSWGGATQSLTKGDRHATKTFTGSAASGNLVISCTRTAKSIYVENITIVTSSSSHCDSVTVSLTTPTHGTANLSKTKVCPNDEIEVTYTPDEGYMLDKILANDIEVENPITITENTTIQVLFKEIPPEPSIDVVEWNPDYIKVDIDNYDAVSAIIQNQNTQLNVENFADSVFFSKYFEAASNVKLLGIYNGTNHTVDLSNYELWVDNDDVTGWKNKKSISTLFTQYEIESSHSILSSGSELILIGFQNIAADSAIIQCAKDSSNSNYETYVRIGQWIDFNGDDAVALVNPEGNLIDLIGAGTKTNGRCLTGGDVVTTNSNDGNVNGFMDKPGGWYTEKGYKSNSNNTEDPNYKLSSNRCLLIRRNHVKSGLNAVQRNTTKFLTLGDYTYNDVDYEGEWKGIQIPGKTSEGGATASCNGFNQVGSYDYNNYYAQYESLDTIPLESGIYDSETGTYTISIPELDTLSCTNLKVIVSDGENTLEKAYKIPIFVQDNITTTHTIFTKEGPDCATCDVVVLNNKTLTVAGTASKNRDVKLYQGAKLIVPTSTTYTINSLALRRDNNTVSTLGYQGTLTLNHLYFDLYIDYKDWYYVALPDTFTLSKLRFANGKNAIHRTDYWVKWYNGKHRAETQAGSWATAPNDTLFQPGAGFIIGLADELIKKELRFEFNAAQTLTNEKNPSGGYKTAGNLRAWGINLDIRPNHKGWNLVGNPYMNIYDTDFAKAIRAGYLEKDMPEGHWNGQWLLSDTISSKTRYAVIPNKAPQFADAGYYESVALDDKPLLPFTCFFVQMGGTNDNAQSLRFNISKKRNNIVARSYQEEEDDELFLRIKVNDWKTGCFISNQFTDEYEPGDDLESRYPIYQTINGFKLLYSAVNDSIIENGIQVTSPSGTLYLDPKVDVSLFDEINVLYNEQWYSLLYGETVNIESGSFILQAKRKNKNVSTDIENVTPTNGLYKFTDGKCIYINKNGYIYNTLGTKLK